MQHNISSLPPNASSEFVLPNGVLLEPRQKEALVKQALGYQSGAQSAAMSPAEAQASMRQFLSQRPVLAGQGVPQTGLDGPSDTRATAMPGTPSQAAVWPA